jgi:hypothetical protein
MRDRPAIRILTRFWRHKQGTALLEFAIAFPFLVVLLFGGIELARYIIIEQKVEKAASVMSSIVTQESRAAAASGTTPASGIDEAELTDNVFPNFDNVLTPFGCCTATQAESVIITSLIKMPIGSPGAPGCAHDTDAACIRVRWQVGFVPQGATGNPGVSAITGLAANDNGGMHGLCHPVTDPSGAVIRRDCSVAVGTTSSVGTSPLTLDEQGVFTGTVPGETGSHPLIDYENIIVTEVFYQYQPILQPLLKGVSGVNGGTVFSVSKAMLAKRIFAYPRDGNLPDLPPNFLVDPSIP